MFSKEDLLKRPNYLLTKYQNEIYRQVISYIQENKISKGEFAEKLGVSKAYVSQILNGNFNFTLKKIIEIGLMTGKVPALEFVDFNEYWRREREGTIVRPTISVTYKIDVHILPVQYIHLIKFSDSDYTSDPVIADTVKGVSISEIEYCPN